MRVCVCGRVTCISPIYLFQPKSPHFNLYCDLGQYATVALPDGTVTNPWHSADRFV